MRTHTSRLQGRLRLIALASSFAPGCLFSQAPTRIPARPPIVLPGQRVNIVIATPRALAQASDSARLAHALESCPAAIRGAFATAYATEPTGARGALRDDRVLFVVVPASNADGGCYPTATLDPALLARGIQIAPPILFGTRTDIRAVEVSSRGQPLPVDSSARRPVVTLAGSTQSIEPPTQIATWISSSYIAPDAAGHIPDVTLRVSAADSSSDTVRLAGEALRDVWRDLIVARTEKLGDARPVHASMQLPLPKDKSLREAHALYSAGNAAAAARIAEQRLATNVLSSEDTRAARMLIVGTLLAYDDTSAARVVLRDVLADAPCLTLSNGQAGAERLIDAMRPPARCSATPLGRVLLASLVPGMGYAATGKRSVAVIAAGLTGAGAALAWTRARSGDQSYQRYLDARSMADATAAYDDASRSRRDARSALGAAGTVWLLSSATALLIEQAHARRLARVHDYDLHPTVDLLPNVHGGEARIAMSVTW